ncbi:MAG: DNA polymerase [Alphaproteobacteria bacterium]|nr:DNA polymerase [Alphaproteobacteria bacterium]
MNRKPKIHTAIRPQSEVRIRRDGAFSKIPIGVKEEYFYGIPAKALKGADKTPVEGVNEPDKNACLVIGFDTEYVPPEELNSREDLKEGRGKARPVSYQVYCRLVDSKSPQNGAEWGAVFYPIADDQRFHLDELISVAVCRGVEDGHVSRVPRRIELISHFSRADMPMLKDLEQLTPFLDAVRGVFVTLQPLSLRYEFESGPVDLKVSIRDTFLLTAEGAKRLEDLGEVVDVPKIKLAETPKGETEIKKRMDLLLERDPDLFERYALSDAVICVRYYEKIRELCRKTIGTTKVPLTLSGIGVKRLQLMWEHHSAIEPLQVLGLEQVQGRTFDDRTGRVYKMKSVVDREPVHLRRLLAVEAYHGGRGEQFWFGPGPSQFQPLEWLRQPTGEPHRPDASAPMIWNDFDLSNAYPTAMSLIGYPDWDNMNIHPTLADFTHTALGVAWVEFEFPSSVRFPCMPVRTDRGIVFPRRGRSYCTAAEIALAVELGASITLKDGAVVPWLTDAIRPFGSFVQNAISERNKHQKGSLENRFWKELVNSLYGKLAQGLRVKRVFNVSDTSMKALEPSPITNPYFAAFVTGYVRAILAEMMNALPQHVHVFSCTTDGFLSTATQEEIDAASHGTLANSYREGRVLIANSDQIVEAKHQTGQLLGWRARGQATLQPGIPKSDEPAFNYVLAKAGIRTPAECETLANQNAHIVQLFLTREPDTEVLIKSLTGVRDIVLDKNDLVAKHFTRRLSMEYDFKRRPDAMTSSVVDGYRHVSWSSRPWETVEQFNVVREELDLYRTVRTNKSGVPNSTDGLRGCIKSQDDFVNFATRIALKASDGDVGYVHAENPDIKLLRKVLCSARYQGEAGLKKDDGLTASQFAEKLTAAGIPCKRTDVENGKKRPFTPRSVTSSVPVTAALTALRKELPAVRISELLTDSKLDLLGGLGSLSTDGRRMGLRLWKYPKAA